MAFKDRIINHYKDRVSVKRKNYDILDWGSEESQLIRFQVLHSILKEKQVVNPHILDVGAGMTDLYTYLDNEDYPFRYTGVDITPTIVEEVNRRHPERELLLTNIFADECELQPKSYDVAFCSGIFNLNLDNNLKFVYDAIPKIAEFTRKYIVANFLHSRTEAKYEHCFYYNPDTLRNHFQESGIKTTIVDNYLENDFSLLFHLEN